MYLLFDIGGTNMRVAASRNGATFERMEKIGTPSRDFNEGITAFCELARSVAGDEPIDGVVGGIAATLNRDHTQLVHSPNISGWVGKPLKETLEERLNAPVFLENDTAVVGLGEASAGAGKGYDIVVYMTVSTGVGGSRIVHGQIDKRVFSFEPGHQIIDMTGSGCPSCNLANSNEKAVGHLEGYASGTALERRYGKKPADIPQDDPIWDELAGFLAVGLNNTIVHWSPDAVVLGGSMMIKTPGVNIETVKKKLNDTLTVFPEVPEIKKAELEDEGGLYGALALLEQGVV